MWSDTFTSYLVQRFLEERPKQLDQLLEAIETCNSYSQLLKLFHGIDKQATGLIVEAIQHVTKIEKEKNSEKSAVTSFKKFSYLGKCNGLYTPSKDSKGIAKSSPSCSTTAETPVGKKKFKRGVTLLGRKDQSTLSKEDKKNLRANLMIFDGVELEKNWTADRLKGFIRDICLDKLSKKKRIIDFEFVKYSEGYFTPFNPPSGQTIDGSFILREVEKMLYVRPKENIPMTNVTVSEDEDDPVLVSDDDTNLLQDNLVSQSNRSQKPESQDFYIDEFHKVEDAPAHSAKRSEKRSVPKSKPCSQPIILSSSSDDEVFLPKKKKQASSSHQDNDEFHIVEDSSAHSAKRSEKRSVSKSKPCVQPVIVSSSSEDEIFLPKKQNKASQENIDDFQIIEDDGKFELIYRDGRRYPLGDVNPESSAEIVSIVLIKMKSKMTNNVMFFRVNRANVVVDFERIRTNMYDFSVLRPMSVKFEGEMGVDLGALSRECLSLLLFNFMEDTTIFVGPLNNKTLYLSAQNCRSKKYKLVGEIIQLALLNDGPKPHFFSKHLYKLVICGSSDHCFLPAQAAPEETSPVVAPLVLEDLDPYLHQSLVEFQAGTLEICNNLLQTTCSHFTQWTGSKHYVSSEEDKKEIIEAVVHYYTSNRILEPVNQLREGLSPLLEEMRLHEKAFEEIFCYTECAIVSAKQVYKLFKAHPITDDEKRVMNYWKQFLQDIEEKKTSSTFSEILAFATGSRSLPAVAYKFEPTIRFISGDLPSTSSCFNILKLPSDVESYEAFETTFRNCIKECDLFLCP